MEKKEKAYCSLCKYFGETDSPYNSERYSCYKNMGQDDSPVGRIIRIIDTDYNIQNKTNNCKYYKLSYWNGIKNLFSNWFRRDMK